MQRLLPLMLAAMLAIGFGTANAQKSKKKDKGKDTEKVTPAKKDDDKDKGPKPYAKFIDSTFTTSKGLMTVHRKKDKYYFEIPEALFGKELMAITRYTKTAAGGDVFGGEEVNEQVVRWEKGPDDNILLRSITYVMMSPDSLSPMFRAVDNSNAAPIIGAFKIEALKKDSVYVIDVTSTFDGDNQAFSVDPRTKQEYNISSLKKEASFIERISTYPTNTEIRTIKTFGVNPPKRESGPSTGPRTTYFPASVGVGVVTLELNTSFVLLPSNPMRKRPFDYRVGYFYNQYSLFEEESHKADEDIFAVRWRLEPKNAADAARQKNGELIEPKKPIVYYIDPATPEKWRPFLKQGVDDWNVGFEAAGWKNAIRGEYWPEDDTTMSLEDARYSVIRYFAADIQNAYGPNVHDPRTGEILESHIGWYHNVMRLLRNWYMIQAAAVDPKARSKEFSDELMGQLVRFVSSHEVGHTLGLRHNMGASSATPVEKLRDKDWVAQNGHTSSIMDYARFNYVAQPGDGVTDLFPRIGDYDVWAIKWGYSYFGDDVTEEQAKATLNAWTKEAYKNRRLWFGTEISPYDPRYQTEDLGDNAMKASDYGIQNLKRLMPSLIEWSAEDGEAYKELEEIYRNVLSQYRRYMGHVIKNVGGIYDSPKTYDMEGPVYEVVPKALQKDAINFLSKQLFTTPTWLMDQSVLNKIKPESGVESVSALQEYGVTRLLEGDRLVRLIETSAQSPNNYSVNDLFTDLSTSILSEVRSRSNITVNRRNLQKIYVDELLKLLEPGDVNVRSIPNGAGYAFDTRKVDLGQTDVPSLARGHLERIKGWLSSAATGSVDQVSKYHIADLRKRIEQALDPR
ncbi:MULTISPECIES: zinc-dependent metalloprotease [unclassified Imperialibacter]|uniref:zinc-dependent metalloprotease n=1 Tax=unclassified Imperialibacter TaxID=2629706 RepID=UPI00125F27AE|nr:MULTISPECIES: zinc-dependent metalloprotease [unclassified Imperialibacter]